MNENYLAKSIPKEDIQTHTNNLLRNYEKLKSLYPNIKVNWSLLYNACLYHDFRFQNPLSRYHGILKRPPQREPSFTKDNHNADLKLPRVSLIIGWPSRVVNVQNRQSLRLPPP